MYRIDINKVITLVAGDTFEYKYKVNTGTNICPVYYSMQDKDHLYFALMEPNQRFEEAVVKKIYDSTSQDEDGCVTIRLESDDTWYLTSGKYYYTIKLEKYIDTVEGKDVFDVITTQPKTLFFLV